MNASDAVKLITQILFDVVQIGPQIYQAAEDLKPVAESIVAVFEGQTLTDDQLAQLQATADTLHSQIQNS